MSDPKKPPFDEAAHGGGIGMVERQPLDPSTRNHGEADPAVPAPETGVEAGLTVDPDARASGADPDEAADETLGTTA